MYEKERKACCTQMLVLGSTQMLVNSLGKQTIFLFSTEKPHVSSFLHQNIRGKDKNDAKVLKKREKMNWTGKRHAKPPFADQNTQQTAHVIFKYTQPLI